MCFVTVNNRVPATSIILADKVIVMVVESRGSQAVLNPVGSTDKIIWSITGVAEINRPEE